MKKLIFVFAIFCMALVACENSGSKNATTNLNQISVDTDSESDKFSYSIGMIIGNTLKNNQIDSIDYDVINRAFEDSEGNQIAYTLISREVQSLLGEEVDLADIDKNIIKKAIDDVLQQDSTILTMQQVNASYRSYLQNNQTKIGEQNLEAGKAFLEANKAKEGVQVTDSGLQHMLIQEGTGETPTTDHVVEVTFRGTNIDGEEFLNTPEGQPAYVDLADQKANIPGLVEGLQLYPAGSQFKLILPSNLAFGNNRMSPEVGPNSTVILEIDSVGIMDAQRASEYRKAREEYMKQMEAMQRQQQGR